MNAQRIAVLAALWFAAAASSARADVPAAPDTVRKLRMNPSQVLITWEDNSDDEKGFRVLRKLVADDVYEERGTVGAGVTQYLDDAPKGDVYMYQVVAFNDDGDSDDSNVCFVNRQPPSKPLYFNVRLIALTVMRVSWSDASNGEKGFEIQRAKLDKPFKTLVRVPANTETYDDYTLDPANTYSYRVRALGKAGICWDNSNWTDPRTDTTKGGVRVLTVELRGRGVGTVTSIPKGISCGPHDDHCSAEFPLATDVTLVAKPNDKSRFAGWADILKCEGLTDPCTMNMGKSRTVGAVFRKLR